MRSVLAFPEEAPGYRYLENYILDPDKGTTVSSSMKDSCPGDYDATNGQVVPQKV